MTCIKTPRCFFSTRLIILILIISQNFIYLTGINDFKNGNFMSFYQRDLNVCKIEKENSKLKNKDHTDKPANNRHNKQYRSNQDIKHDKEGYEAISHLHSLIDDDQDGDLDRYESQEFLEDDLNRDLVSVGSSHYHLNNDLVSVDELWYYWLHSAVYNWTVEDVVEWVEVVVDLPQYSHNFKFNTFNGTLLPRLASSLYSPLYTTLSIRNVFHRQKITLKAIDIVLFGPTKVQHSYLPDGIFVVSLLLLFLSCMVAWRQRKRHGSTLANLNSELLILQGVRGSLNVFQAQLEESQKKKREEEEARDELKKKLQKRKRIFAINCCDSDNGTDDNDVYNNDDDDDDASEESNEKKRFQKLKKELQKAMIKLFQTERMLEERRRQSTTPELQQWFQMTYEVENRYIKEKKSSIEKNLTNAINKCEKLKRQRFKILSSIKEDVDMVDGAVLFKKEMQDLHTEMREMAERWTAVELLTSMNITTNPGIPYLNSLLRNNVAEKMSSKNLLSMNFNRSQTDYPITSSNLLRAGIQLTAIGVNANPTFPAATHQHNIQPFYITSPTYSSFNDNNYHNMYQPSNPLNNTQNNVTRKPYSLNGNTNLVNSSDNTDNSLRNIPSIPKSFFLSSQHSHMDSYTPPQHFQSFSAFEAFNRLTHQSLGSTVRRPFTHSKTLSDLIYHKETKGDVNQFKSTSDLSKDANQRGKTRVIDHNVEFNINAEAVKDKYTKYTSYNIGNGCINNNKDMSVFDNYIKFMERDFDVDGREINEDDEEFYEAQECVKEINDEKILFKERLNGVNTDFKSLRGIDQNLKFYPLNDDKEKNVVYEKNEIHEK